MDQLTQARAPALQFLVHHLYEYRKGIRHLFMMTMSPSEALLVERRLQREAVAHFIQHVSATKTNVFFGRGPSIEIVRRIVTKPLCQLSPEEDFILGTLLGYDQQQQCLRFLAMTKMGRPVAVPSSVA